MFIFKEIRKVVAVSLLVSFAATATSYADNGNNKYQVSFVNQESKYFDSLSQANALFSPISKDGYIKFKGQIVDMKYGYARTKGVTYIHSIFTDKVLTYVSKNTELDVIDIEGNKAIISFAGIEGYVKKESVELVPYSLNRNKSYYEIKDGNVTHHVYGNGGFKKIELGIAQDVKDGTYNSFNGINVNGKNINPYFQFLPLRVQTSYSGTELDDFIKHYSPTSSLIGYGDTFVSIGNKYHVNALYLLSHAILESGWGSSDIAKDKNNLFGYGAVDSSPYEGAVEYESYRSSIEGVAKKISQNYLAPESWLYQGGFLGNKGKGMNVMYASDPYWGEKINSLMTKADEFLGSKDRNKYRLATISNRTNLYRFEKGELHTLPALNKERVVAILDVVKISNDLFYKVSSDNTQYEYLLIKSDSVESLPVF